MDKLKEDTVSADRKERIIFDPAAWRKSDKSGRKTSAITSRQNFDNEKFTRKAKEETAVDESVIQADGTSKIDPNSNTASDTISKDKVKKSNSPQIEFVTGNAQQAASVTASGGALAGGRKIGESYRRDDAYTRDYKSSVSGMGKHQSAAYHADGGANDEGWGNERHKPRSTMDRPHTVHINGKPWKKFSNGHQAHAAARTLQAKGKDAHAIAHFNEDLTQEETNMSEKKTYAQFMEQLLEYTPGPGGVTRVKGRSYGADYDAGEGEDDDAPKKAAEPAVKRGRGRPAGSKSGANQKVTTGKSYGGIATHSLNLPNGK
mgnify:FL=1